MELISGRLSVGIAGAGIIGMSAAWRLAQAGFDVTVYEKSTVGSEASWAGAGMLAPGGEFEEDSELARLAVESRDLYRAFVEELQQASGLEIDFRETGALEVAYSPEELNLLDHRADHQAAIGIPSKRILAETIATFWPRVEKERLAGGYFYPGDATVDPRNVVAALSVACEKMGVRLRERCEVKVIALNGSSVRIGENGHDAVIIACGAWSGSIAAQGIPAWPGSEPVRGHLLGYKQPEQMCNTIIRRGHTYLLQRSNGFLIVGASVERVGFDRSLDQNAVIRLEREAASIMPHLGETSPSEIWNGFRPGSDELHIGRWHSDRVYLAYGHYRNGILLAPVTAQRLTQQISANLQRR